MKKIKFTTLAFLAITAFAFLFSSCESDENYSRSNYWNGIATVYPEENGNFYLVLENAKLGIKESDVKDYNPIEGQRALVQFSLLEKDTSKYDFYIKLEAIQDVLSKKIIDLTSSNAEELGVDPIKVLSLPWISDNYLNIHYGYNVGDKPVVHFINLVQNKLEESSIGDGDEPIRLEFRHNANGDGEISGTTGYVSFDLSPFQVEDKDSVSLKIKVKDFTEDRTYNINYKYR
ncbi:hypothetical protein D0T53_06145 [Dysgonomonas sp. 216]|uniref:NigD-like protein n=1 Tax=Dysgonomonas sp. 216 TaxID=2302934 RepID=UPI0013D6D5A6|nr:NigD-like protein [Dysgonomonas sp. 216]NDW18494.1 hypothetical protein [Dysgonomonas sp. 216]